MKKFIAINGSPRKNGNTAELLKFAAKGAENHWAQFNMNHLTNMYERFAENILGVKPKSLCAFNTVQFKDYSKYESSIFNEQHKLKYKEENWAAQCEDAEKIGRELILG